MKLQIALALPDMCRKPLFRLQFGDQVLLIQSVNAATIQAASDNVTTFSMETLAAGLFELGTYYLEYFFVEIFKGNFLFVIFLIERGSNK